MVQRDNSKMDIALNIFEKYQKQPTKTSNDSKNCCGQFEVSKNTNFGCFWCFARFESFLLEFLFQLNVERKNLV
jgi:hypothetical protein